MRCTAGLKMACVREFSGRGMLSNALHKGFCNVPELLLVQVHYVPKTRRNCTLNCERRTELWSEFQNESGALDHESVS
jgi:hypothetical protein